MKGGGTGWKKETDKNSKEIFGYQITPMYTKNIEFIVY